MGNGPIYNGGENENFEIQFLARNIYQYGFTVYQKMQNGNIWGGMFSIKKNYFSIFSWENHDLWFLRLQWNSIVISKIINHDFLMKILKNHFFYRKHTPPKCCYSASFGILWTHIDEYFWPKIGFQNFHFFPHYKLGHFPLFHKTLRLIANLLSINLIFGMQLLSH